MGKPIYTPELADSVLEALARTGSLRAVCKEVGISRDTVVRWVLDDINGFASAYAHAKDVGIDNLVDETLEISDAAPPLTPIGVTDSGAVAHAKVRIETRRWLAERMAPKRYGLKQGLDMTNSDGSLAIDDATRSARLAQILATAQARKVEDENSDLA